jgi:hypothetical protein
MAGNDGLSGLEQAIRNALERAERSDPDIRARIYQSARNALDLGLRKQEIADPAVIERQRQRLEATIGEIEQEELGRLRAIARFERVALEREPEPDAMPEVAPEPQTIQQPARQAPAVSIDPPVVVRRADDVPAVEPTRPDAAPVEAPALSIDGDQPHRASSAEPAITIEPETRRQQPGGDEPVMDDGSLSGFSATRDSRSLKTAAPAVIEDADYDVETLVPAAKRRNRLGSLLVSAFVYLFLLGIIGGGVWWVYDTGMIEAAMKGEGSFELVPKVLQSEAEPDQTGQRLETLRGFSSDWIDIYKPGTSASAVAARDKASIEEHRDSDGLATVITSNAPDQDGDVLVEIPASFLQEMSGKTSTLAVTVKSNSDKPAQIYIQCEFKSLGDCGRHRYTVTNERADELIQMKFEGKLAPSTPGHIVINSDLTGEGASIRLYGIRVLPGS